MKEKTEDDVALVKSLSKGNVLAFNTLFKKYSNRLYHFAFGYLKSEVESEEIVQEVFTKIWEKRSEIKKELSFKSYLFTIAFNIIRKHFRTQAYICEYFRTKNNNDLDFHTSQKIDFNSLQGYISELIDKMPERRREIFIKSRLKGLSINEIAEELEISHKTVENQLSSALKYIRSCLNNEELHVILFFTLFLL